jgi:molybdopterin molybdotransferase
MAFAFMSAIPVSRAQGIWAAALAKVPPVRESEPVGLLAGLGRVLSSGVHAAEDVPGFNRSTVDGYAVRAADTFGASEALPAYLRIAGEIMSGAPPGVPLAPISAMAIPTGGMLPEGADAVVMLEYCEPAGPGEVGVNRPVGPGENVISRGEDVKGGAPVLAAGHRLRPQDLGVLAAVGVTSFPVLRRPRVAILSTGDELVPPEGPAGPGPGQVRDINASTLAAMVADCGGEPLVYGIVRDDLDSLREGLRSAMGGGADMLLVSGGSSVGVRDFVARAVNELGSPGVLVHGIALRPGKPTVLAVARDKPVIGLPGHPASALVVFWLFGRQALERISGATPRPGWGTQPAPAARARLTHNIASVAGREDFVRVALSWDETAREWLAEPVFGPSGLVSTLVRGDGLVRVPEESTGLDAGALVDVLRFGGAGW